MIALSSLARVVTLSFLYGLSLGGNGWLRIFLRQDSGEGLVSALARNFDAGVVLLPSVVSSAVGVVLYVVGGWLASRGEGRREASRELAAAYVVLLVPIGLTVSCLLSLAVSPAYPYGSNLVLTLALEGTFAELLTIGLFASAFLRALGRGSGSGSGRWREAARRLSLGTWPRGAVALVVAAAAIAGFTWATPERFYRDGVGQGNMYKYLRMAAAAAGSGSLDIARADDDPSPGVAEALGHVPRVASAYAKESLRLASAIAGAAARGELYTGERTAARANRSMFRSAEGGVYYINAPGPGLLLVPAYLADRALNRAFGWERQLAVIVFWHLVGALVVLEMVRATEGRGPPARAPGLVTAFAIAFTVPVLFYTFQVYPELPGALFLLFAFRKLVLDPSPTRRGILAGGVALAALPWLHQKYSVTAAALALWAAYRIGRASASAGRRRAAELFVLLAPLVVSAYSIFLYNHALTGSLSPAATFASAERSSFEPRNVVRGFLGLLLDRDNGLFVFAPLGVLALAGMGAFFRDQRPARLPFVLSLGSYLLVIGSFPYWPGAVSTMGRYISSIVPLLALPMVYMVRRSFVEGRVLGAGLVLGAASYAFSVSFARDLIPSYQPELLWGRVLYSDPAQYLPSLLSAGFIGSGPAHHAKLFGQIAVIVLVVALVRKSRPSGEEGSRFGRELTTGASAVLVTVVVLGAVLERWPGNSSSGPGQARDVLELSRGRGLTVSGRYGFEQNGVWVPGGGTTRFELLSRERLDHVELAFTNGPHPNTVRIAERHGPEMAIELPPAGPHRRRIRLRNPFRFSGPRGERFVYRFEVRSVGGFVPREEGRGDDERRLGVYVRVR